MLGSTNYAQEADFICANFKITALRPARKDCGWYHGFAGGIMQVQLAAIPSTRNLWKMAASSCMANRCRSWLLRVLDRAGSWQCKST